MQWETRFDKKHFGQEKKGDRAERKVIDVLKQQLPNFTFLDTSSGSDKGKGDIEAQSPNGHKVMIEVKDWKVAIAKDETEKFEKNLANSPYFKVGILLSMTSGIAMRSREGRFEIAFNQNQKQYQIYVPNASNEEHLIVWSVVMADQLKIQGDLSESKTSGLNMIYKKFADNIKHSEKCKSNLEALEICVTNLKETFCQFSKPLMKPKQIYTNFYILETCFQARSLPIL